MRPSLLAATLFLCLASCLAFGQSLQIQAFPPQGSIVGEAYTLPLAAIGGQAPFTWQLVSGNLPPGMALRPHSGKITGTPTTPGEYTFTISVADSNIPSLQAQRSFTVRIIAGLTVDWKEAPKVHGTAISGSAVVVNQTLNDFDLTVLIVAVNDIGRATTLGYQHFKLSAQTSSPVIPFGSSPGEGTYYVRVDAVAHRPGHQHVYRASKQTSDPLTVTQF